MTSEELLGFFQENKGKFYRVSTLGQIFKIKSKSMKSCLVEIEHLLEKGRVGKSDTFGLPDRNLKVAAVRTPTNRGEYKLPLGLRIAQDRAKEGRSDDFSLKSVPIGYRELGGEQ